MWRCDRRREQIWVIGAAAAERGGRGEGSRAWLSLGGYVRALLADRLEATSRFFCGPGFTAQGEIRLASARIGASLDLTGAHLSDAPGAALSREGLTVGAIMNCCGGFTADQMISLVGAQVASELCCESAFIHAAVDLHSIQAGNAQN